MCVGRAEDEIVLNDEGGDPEIVCRDGGTFLTQLQVEVRVVMRRLIVRQQDRDAGTVEEAPEIGRVDRGFIACGKAGAQFPPARREASGCAGRCG